MHTKIITSTEEFYKLKDDWERLQEQDPNVTYYSTFEYNRAWWDVDNDPEKNSLFIICVYVDKDIVAIAPLMIETVKKIIFSYKTLKFIGRGDYFNFILDKSRGVEMQSIKNIFREIFASNEWERLRLTHISSNTPLAYFMLSRMEYNEEFQYLVECPIIDFSQYDSFEQYKKIYSVDKNKRFINRLQNEIGYKFEVVKNNEVDVYEKISQLHIREQEYLRNIKGKKERESLYSNNKYSKFVKNIYEDNEKVITFILKDNASNLLAYDTCYFYKDMLHSWNSAYNPQYEKYSLNVILYYETFKYLFQSKLASKFEFGTGRYPWKFKWTKDFMFIYQFNMWNDNTKKSKILKLLYRLLKGKN